MGAHGRAKGFTEGELLFGLFVGVVGLPLGRTVLCCSEFLSSTCVEFLPPCIVLLGLVGAVHAVMVGDVVPVVTIAPAEGVPGVCDGFASEFKATGLGGVWFLLPALCSASGGVGV